MSERISRSIACPSYRKFLIGSVIGIKFLSKQLERIFEKLKNAVAKRLFQVGPVDKLKKNDLLYGIIVISIAGGHFYDGKTEWTNSDGGDF